MPNVCHSLRAVRLKRWLRDCAMSRRPPWFLAIAILSLLGTAPVLARDGADRVGMAGLPSASSVHVPRARLRSAFVMSPAIALSSRVQDGLRFRPPARFPSGLPIAIWPYSPPIEMTPTEMPLDENELSTTPQVIVMSGWSDRAPECSAPGAPQDYGYVAGCRAILNGYHCDVPHNEAAP